MAFSEPRSVTVKDFLAHGTIPLLYEPAKIEEGHVSAGARSDTVASPRHRRNHIQLLVVFVVIVYSVGLSPRAVVDSVLLCNAFGLVDKDTYERVKEETTDREVGVAPPDGVLPCPVSVSRARSITRGAAPPLHPCRVAVRAGQYCAVFAKASHYACHVMYSIPGYLP